MLRIMPKLAWLLGLFAIPVLIPSVNALDTGTVSTTVTNGFLGAFTINSSNTPIYAALFALVIFVIFYQLLQRTTLGGGAAAIALVFAAIVFVFLYTTPSYIQLFLNISIVTAIMAILLIVLLIPTRRGMSFSKVIGVLLLLTLFYVILVNNPSVSNSINQLTRVNVENILPLIIISALVIGIIVLLIRAFRSTTHTGLKAIIPIFILGLIIFFFVPGAAAFLLSPLSLIFYGLVFLGALIWWIFAHGRPKEEDKSEKDFRHKNIVNSFGHLPPPAPRSNRGPIKGWLPPSAQKSDKDPIKEWTQPAKEKTGFWNGSGKGTTKLKDLDLRGKRIEVDKGGKTIFRWKSGDKKGRGGEFVDSEDYKK